MGLTLGSTVMEVGFSKLACVRNHLGTWAVTQLGVGPRSLHFLNKLEVRLMLLTHSMHLSWKVQRAC